MAPILQKMEGQDFRLLIISDHKTLTETRGHDADYVPFLVYDSTTTKGSYTENNALPQFYHEKEAKKGTSYEDGAALCMPLLFGTFEDS